VLSAERLALDKVPTITLPGLTDDQKRAYVIADNKLALNAAWNWELLASEIDALKATHFDTALIGFADLEIANLLGHTIDAMATNANLRDAEPNDRDMWPVLKVPMPPPVKARIDQAMALHEGEDWQKLEAMIFGDAQP
jgi:ParB-like chromosome segregation protein Spo0J